MRGYRSQNAREERIVQPHERYLPASSFICLLVHSLNKYLLNTCYVLDIVSGAKDRTTNRTDEQKMNAFMRLTH